jgi:hypothetical protein
MKMGKGQLLSTRTALGLIFVLIAIIGTQPLATLYAGLVLLVGIGMLWRPGESPILLFIFVYQWFQASVKVLQVGLTGQPWWRMAEFGGDIETAAYLSLTGLLLLAVGLRWGAGKWQAGPSQLAHNLAASYSLSTWLRWYIIALGIAIIAGVAAQTVPALAQPLLALAAMKWAFFFMYTYAAFLRPARSRVGWSLVFLIELALGFGGYFSEFKQVLFFTLLGIAATGVRITPAKLGLLTTLSAITLFLAVMWTAVKVEYRDFVSGGQKAQVVNVSYAESLSKLADLVSTLDAKQLDVAWDRFLNRLAYVDFFGVSLNYVPQVRPHTGGELWLDAMTRPFMPRVFFPGKTAIHDSERTMKYTGLRVAGAKEGTSISIGYMGESYIDFGRFGMMVPILVFGWLLGRTYRWLVCDAPTRGLLGMGLASAVLFGAAYLESSITKVFGGFAAAVLVVWLLNRFVFPVCLRWCLNPQGKGRRLRHDAHLDRRPAQVNHP